MKSVFLPKYEPNTLSISACTVPHYKAEILTIFILKFTDLYHPRKPKEENRKDVGGFGVMF